LTQPGTWTIGSLTAIDLIIATTNAFNGALEVMGAENMFPATLQVLAAEKMAWDAAQQ
jgi:hypothetical protein